jgi:DNA-binding winged helix-turn-helix (wHTH) protein
MAVYTLGDFKIDTGIHELSAKGKEIDLEPMALKLLEILCPVGQSRISVAELCQQLWGPLKTDCTHRLHVLASEIRRALGPEAGQCVQINSKRGCRLATVQLLEPSVPSLAKQTDSDRLILDSQLHAGLLKLYYPDSDLRAQNLFRYSYAVDGRTMITNIVTSDQWLGLALPITETDHQSFPIEKPSSSWVPVSDAVVDRLHKESESKGVVFYNKPIYCLRSFDPRGQHAVASFAMAHYADYKVKLGRLEEETTKALEHSGFSAKVAYDKRRTLMPIRKELLPNSRVIANYSERLCAGGTNVLFAMRRPELEGFTFYVKRRSTKVSTGKNVFSLIPSGMHQPVTGASAQEETSVAATVYRETWEELFGGKEVEGEDEHYKPLWFMSTRQLAWFRNNLGSFTLEVVSFGLNLMDGTFEFGVLLVIKDPDYWEQFADGIIPNIEFKDSATAPFNTTDRVRLASLLGEPQCADTSRIALVEGLRRLHQLEPRSVVLPNIEIIK